MSLSKKIGGAEKPSAFQVHVNISHAYLAKRSEEQAFYVLLNINHAANLPFSRLPLNLCLVLDRSTSMKGVRLQQVKQGVIQIIDQLTPEDALSVVVFSDRAEVLLPSQRNVSKTKAKALVNQIEPGGGTEMLPGLTAGLEQLEQYRTDSTVNHLIFLTDGRTYGDEDACVEKSQWAGLNNISLTTMGIGDDWNDSLLDQMAMNSGGTSVYIQSPREIAHTFRAVMHDLSSVVAKNLHLSINPSKGVRLQEAYVMSPYIARLGMNEGNVMLGPLLSKFGKTMLMEFRILTEFCHTDTNLLALTIQGDVSPTDALRNWTTELVSVKFLDHTVRSTIPSVVITALGKLTIFKLQEKALRDLDEGKITEASHRLETMATRLLNIGETELARSALLEAGRLAHTGDISAEGRKKIRYGTRSLSLLSKEIQP